MLPIYSILLSDPDKADLFDEIYDKYKNKLYWVINGILKNHHDSEEVLQEVFIHIAKNIHKVSDSSSSETQGYVFVIAKNAAINRFKSDVLKKGYDNIDDCINIRSSDDIAKEIETKEQTQMVFEFVDKLPEAYQTVFYLRYIVGYSVSDIANINGEKTETVKTRFVRLNKMIRNFAKENLK